MAEALEHIDGKYEILEKLKEGGMGAIYKVRHRLLEEVRVIKVMRPTLRDDEELYARFLREAKMAIQLRHPNIAQLYDFTIDDDGNAFIVMEFIGGLNFGDLIDQAGPPPLGLTLEMAVQSLKALDYLHRQGFVHRDISPDNLMLSQDFDERPLIKLIDLGIAKALEGNSDLTATGHFLGKVRYCSPEQLESTSSITPCSDLYSFGLVLYELLTGQCPIAGDTPSALIAGHLMHPPTGFEKTDPKERVPTALRTAVLRSLEKKAENRFASAEEFLRALEKIQQQYPFTHELSQHARTLLDRDHFQVSQQIEPGSTQHRLDQEFGLRATPQPEERTDRLPEDKLPPNALAANASAGAEQGLQQRLREVDELIRSGQYPEAINALDQLAALAQGSDAELLQRVEKFRQSIRSLQDRTSAIQPPTRPLVAPPPPPLPLVSPAPPRSVAAATPTPAPPAAMESAVPETRPLSSTGSSIGSSERSSIGSSPAAVDRRTDVTTGTTSTTATGGKAGRRWLGAVLVLLVLGLAGVAAWYFLGRGDTGPVEVPAKASGRLVLNAMPWAQVTGIVDAEGEALTVAPGTYTPAALDLPPGRYTITLRREGATRDIEAEVVAGELTRLQTTLQETSADDLLQQLGW